MKAIHNILLLLFALAASACYEFPPPEVVEQTNPSPLRGARSFVIAPATFDGFTYAGQPEAAWLRTRDAKQVNSWENDKLTMSDKLLKRFNQEKQDDQTFTRGDKAAPGGFLVAVNFDAYDGQMRWTAEIRDDSGKIVDIVRDPKAVVASFNTWMAEESGAQLCALMVSKYLHSRAFPVSK